ncbi:hypothetical protein [Aquimonas sp.]|jgi:hypothetical protein|uniref:hypothetical protein n=1 Tax=Aquimonas sp. TaxID=1872588 RepID=UPI0037C15D69
MSTIWNPERRRVLGAALGAGACAAVGGFSAAQGAAAPAWRLNRPALQWFSIPGTAGAGGSAIDAYCGMALKPATGELVIAAAGGHSDSADNGVYSLSLFDDTPRWRTRRVGSTQVQPNVLYYADGLPTSRHTYAHIHYVESRDAVLLAGCRFGFGGGTPSGPGMDLFHLGSDAWLPRFTFADITPFDGFGVVLDAGGNVWTTSGRRFLVAGNTWSRPGNGTLGRFPAALDPGRNVLFSLQFGDGQGYDPQLGVVARVIDANTGNGSAVAFENNAALSAFISAAPAYAGMDFDPLLNRFCFYHHGETGRVYTATPGAGAAWRMDLLPTVGTPAGGPPSGSGIQRRFLYVPALRGFVLLARAAADLWFLPTADLDLVFGNGFE